MEAQVDIKEAVADAKKYVSEIFAEEGIANLSLEEIEFDDADGTWNVTVGFDRVWSDENPIVRMARGRIYKRIGISDSDGRLRYVKNR